MYAVVQTTARSNTRPAKQLCKLFMLKSIVARWSVNDPRPERYLQNWNPKAWSWCVVLCGCSCQHCSLKHKFPTFRAVVAFPLHFVLSTLLAPAHLPLNRTHSACSLFATLQQSHISQSFITAHQHSVRFLVCAMYHTDDPHRLFKGFCNQQCHVQFKLSSSSSHVACAMRSLTTASPCNEFLCMFRNLLLLAHTVSATAHQPLAPHPWPNHFVVSRPCYAALLYIYKSPW